ncbi:head-tail adaptor [Mycobacterium phage DS6A]|uniref:Head-to-tail stopper n=1 Tax=Mycobacterium phage DS6A TaxID=45764 RepID=G8I4C3_9CAUD|nr:head-tail adaptor [Mycobacterium phage DS6A]AER47567.1 head-to-tail stopper [Mycobacterium phage DS6A]
MFPRRHKVKHIPCVGTQLDRMKNEKPVFGEPVEIAVFGWVTRRDETILAGHEARIVSRLDVTMPADAATVGLLDQFEVAGELYEVLQVRDYSTGWHGWRPGMVVELKRVTG